MQTENEMTLEDLLLIETDGGMKRMLSREEL